MTLHPEVQKKAQLEIDTIVGGDRLPTYADREHLPYVNALVLEVLRSHPVGPLGLPHRVLEDDVYEGYHIPRGTLVIANVWYVRGYFGRCVNACILRDFLAGTWLMTTEHTPTL